VNDILAELAGFRGLRRFFLEFRSNRGIEIAESSARIRKECLEFAYNGRVFVGAGGHRADAETFAGRGGVATNVRLRC